jgi:hypothetical protein
MQADRHERRPRGSAATVGEWSLGDRREPRLEELMEDPMMGLIWRRDGLEPVRARQTVRELQAIVQAGR